MSSKLGFPPHICLVDGGQLSAYSLSKGQVHELAPLPTKTSSGQTLAAQKLVHSQKQNACLVFFQSSPGQQHLAPSSLTMINERTSLCGGSLEAFKLSKIHQAAYRSTGCRWQV